MTSTPASKPTRGARYLLRFDDVCPTMDWAIWNRVEPLLDAHGVKPLLAVIPDNRDPKLMIDPPAEDFWDRVRAWQAKGWAIGLHGYQHLYVNHEPGLVKISDKSEFAGLAYEEQLDKLRRGVEIFAREGVRVDAWVAPSHSFDGVTLSALNALGICTISDGLALSPFRDPGGNTWVPQQFAMMRPFPFGIWTFCYHRLDFITEAQWAEFGRRLAQLGPAMIPFQEAVAAGDRSRALPDRLVGVARRMLALSRKFVGRFVRR